LIRVLLVSKCDDFEDCEFDVIESRDVIDDVNRRAVGTFL